MDGYAEPPSAEKDASIHTGYMPAGGSGYASLYETEERNAEKALVTSHADDDQASSGSAYAEPQPSAGAKPKRAKKSTKKKKKQKKAKKAKASTKAWRKFEVDEATLQRERELRERLASAYAVPDPALASEAEAEEPFLPFFSTSASSRVGSAYAAHPDDDNATTSAYAEHAEVGEDASAAISAYGSVNDEVAAMKSVYGFDCYEEANNSVEDLDEEKEAVLESAYALTPDEERELEGAKERARSIPASAYAGGDGYSQPPAQPKQKRALKHKPKSQRREELAQAYAGETFIAEDEAEGAVERIPNTPNRITGAYSDVPGSANLLDDSVSSESDSDHGSESESESESSPNESDESSESDSESESSEETSDSDSDPSTSAAGHNQSKEQVVLQETGRQWNEEFQCLCEPILGNDPEVTVQRAYTIYKLFLEFQQTAAEIGKVIIDEVHLPKSRKKYPPINAGGQAGGEKFLYENIFFKFCFDLHGYYGGDEFAMKSAGLELNGLRAYYKFITEMDKRELHVPLMILIDYKGYRLVATSVLPLGKDTLVYGSADGGVTVHTDNKRMNRLMKEAAAFIGIKGHVVGTTNPKKLYSAGDIEGHLGKDGRLYVLDTARVYPPTPPSSVMRGLLIMADEKSDPLEAANKRIDLINLTIPQYENEARKLLVSQAKDRKRHLKLALSSSNDSDSESDDESQLTVDQLAFRIQKCILPMGGVMFFEGKGDVNLIASYLAHRTINGNAVLVPAGFQGKRLYNLFRGEFLAHYVAKTGIAISSDAFTGFGKDKWAIHNKEARDAGNYLIQTAIPETINKLQQTLHPRDGSQLTYYMHQCGINMRFLGYVWRSPNLTLGSLRTLVLIEMVTRAIKSVLRSVMRSAVSEREMAEEIVKHFNFLLGQSNGSHIYWNSLVRTQILFKFEIDLASLENGLPFTQAESFKYSLKSRLEAQLGICFAGGFKPDFSSSHPFSISHYLGIVPIINELISESTLTNAMAQAIHQSTEREPYEVIKPGDKAKLSGNAQIRQEQVKLEMIKHIKALLERTFGPDNVRVAVIRLRLANSYHKIGKRAKGFRLVNELLHEFIELPVEIFIIARCLRGDFHAAAGDIDKAITEYYNSLRVANRFFGEGTSIKDVLGHPLSLIILHKLGTLLYQQHMYDLLEVLCMQYGLLTLQFCPYTTPEMQKSIWGVDIPILLGIFNERWEKLEQNDEWIAFIKRTYKQEISLSTMTMLGMQNRDFYSSQYPPPPGEDIVSRARSFLAFLQAFNELHYTEVMLSGISVSTTIALADNEKLSVDVIPPIYLMKKVENTRLTLASYEVTRGETIYVSWKYRMDSSAPKLYMRIYPYQGLVYNTVETEFDAIKRIYLNKIPLGSHSLQGLSGAAHFESGALEPGPYLITLEDENSWGWGKFQVVTFVQVLPLDSAKKRLIKYAVKPRLKNEASSKVRVLDVFNDETILYVCSVVKAPKSNRVDFSRTFVTTEKGEIFSWSLAQAPVGLGHNIAGEMEYFHHPRPISALVGRKIAKIAVAEYSGSYLHVLALTEDKRAVYSWGTNKNGQLGRGIVSDSEAVGLIESLEGEIILDIACGHQNSKAVTSDGRVFLWGSNAEGLKQLGPDFNNHAYPVQLEGIGQRIVSIASSGLSTVALSEEGMVWMWGHNFGNIQTIGQKYAFPVPWLVETLVEHFMVAAVCGDRFVALLSDKGQVYCAGFGAEGVLGNGSNKSQYFTLGAVALPKNGPPPHKEPVQGHLRDKKVVQIHAQDSLCCALTEEGEVYYWGEGYAFPRLARELNVQGRGDKRARIKKLFAGTNARIFAFIDETSSSMPPFPPPGTATPRGQALREKLLLGWKTSFTIDRHEFLQATGDKYRFVNAKWARPNFLSLQDWSIGLYHESKRYVHYEDYSKDAIEQWPAGEHEKLDTATQVWHGELKLNFRQFKEPGTYYLVMKKRVQPTIPNPYFLSVAIHVRSLEAEDFFFDCPRSVQVAKPFSITYGVREQAKGSVFSLMIAKVDAEGRLMYQEDQPNIPHMVAVENIEEEQSIRGEGKWEVSGLWSEGSYAFVIYYWDSKRVIVQEPLSVRDDFMSADDVLSFEVSPITVNFGQPISISWNFRPGSRPDSYQYFGIYPVSDTTDTQAQGICQVSSDCGEATINAPYVAGTYTIRYLAVGSKGMKTIYRCPTVITAQAAPPVQPVMPSFPMMNPYMMQAMALNPYMQQAMAMQQAMLAMNPYLAQMQTATPAMASASQVTSVQSAGMASAPAQTFTSPPAMMDPMQMMASAQAMQAMMMNPQMMAMMNPAAMMGMASSQPAPTASSTQPTTVVQGAVHINPQSVIISDPSRVIFGGQPPQTPPPSDNNE